MPNAPKPSVSTPHRAARSTGWTPTVSTSPSAHCRGGLGSRDPSSLPRRGVGRDRALPAAAPRLSSSGPRGVRQARPSSLFQRGARQGSRLFPGPVALLFKQLPRGSRQPRSLFPHWEGCGQGPSSSRGSASFATSRTGPLLPPSGQSTRHCQMACRRVHASGHASASRVSSWPSVGDSRGHSHRLQRAVSWDSRTLAGARTSTSHNPAGLSSTVLQKHGVRGMPPAWP